MDKTAATQIPLSPEESYEASRLFGRSLFNMLQLAKENEARKNALRAAGESQFDSGDTLRIPIPKALLPSQKTASFGSPPYITGRELPEPPEAEGTLPQIKRNLGKYLGGFAGTALGSSIGTSGALARNSRAGIGALGKGLKGGAVGGILGILAGHLFDEATKKEYQQKMLYGGANQKELIKRLYQSGELENILNSPEFNKSASDETQGIEPGFLARAFKPQEHPVRLFFGGQEGFRDAKRDYYNQQKAKIQKELMQAQQDYIDTLGRIKTGECTTTPNVDAFCNGLAYAALFEKDAEHQDMDISQGATKRLLQDVFGVVKKPVQEVTDPLLSSLINAGTGTGIATYLIRKSMREKPDKYLQEGLPTKVELAPY